MRKVKTMNVIICIDENQGMLFNNRRQSKDIKVIEDIASLAKELWISPFSEKLFIDENVKTNLVIQVRDNAIIHADEGSYCFVENEKLMPYQDKIEQLIIYKWNRSYPSDFKLDLNLNEWKLIETIDFAGNSHEKITREIYKGQKGSTTNVGVWGRA